MSAARIGPLCAAAPSPGSVFDVIMLTTAHSAVDPRIFHREARTLERAGLSVCVIGKHAQSEYRDGIWIESLPRPANRLHRFLMGRTLLERARRFRGRLYIFHDPELFGVALILRALGRQVVYDCHENLPMQVLQKTWIPKPIRVTTVPIIAAIEWIGARLLTGVMTVNETLQKRFPRNRTVVVRNLPTAPELEIIGQGPPLHARANAVIYSGGLSRIRGIAELVEAFRGINSGAELWLVGDFAEPGFRERILKSLPDNVKWFGQRSWEEALQFYQRAKLGAVLHYPTPNHRNAMPVKLFEYLGAGLPVIASNMPEFTELLQGCGVQVDPKNVLAIRTTIETLLRNDAEMAAMSKIGRQRITESFSWESEAEKLVGFCNHQLKQSAF